MRAIFNIRNFGNFLRIFPNIALLQTIMASTMSETVKRLNDFGYGFDKGGILRQFDNEKGELTDKGFDFNFYDNHSKNQQRYEELGEIINDYVYGLMEEKGMYRVKVPFDGPDDCSTFVFSTQKELKSPEKLLVLIHGSGVVRAGQWARSLIINHSTESGTQIPYVEEGKTQGFEVISTNTNDNFRESKKQIPKSSSPIEHANYVWKHLVVDSNPGAVAIVAHSYGGVVTMDLAKRFPEFFKEKVFAIAFTDSVGNQAPESIRSHINKITVNWAASSEPLNKVLKPASNSVEFRSANHPKHEFTSHSSFSAIFEFFGERYEKFLEEKRAKKPKVSNEL